MKAEIIQAKGFGAPVNIKQDGKKEGFVQQKPKTFSNDKTAIETEEFLHHYKNGISKLPRPGKNAAYYLASLDDKAKPVFATILPTAAAIKHRNPSYTFEKLIEKTKAFCLEEIDKVLASN
jgi:hypothetical protein